MSPRAQLTPCERRPACIRQNRVSLFCSRSRQMDPLACALVKQANLKHLACMSSVVTPVQVGHGKETFQRAKDAVSRWDHFQLGWARVDPDTPIEEDTAVCVESKPVPFLPIWTACPLRVVYVPLSSFRIQRHYTHSGLYSTHRHGTRHRTATSWPVRELGVLQMHASSRTIRS